MRVFGLALSVGVHLAVLLYLLMPVVPYRTPHRSVSEPVSSLQVILLDTVPPLPAAIPVEPVVPTAETPPSPPRPQVDRPVTATRVEPKPAAPVPEDAPISAAQLFGGIEGAAQDLTANDRPLPGAGLPSARARLPGSSEAIVDLPVRFKRRPTPQQVTTFLAKMLIGTMADYPDDFESATELRSPLGDMTDTHLGSIREPECNDPDDPLRDPRCLERPQR